MNNQFDVSTYDAVSRDLKDIINRMDLSDGRRRAVIFDIDETLLTAKNLKGRIKNPNDIFKLQYYPIFAGIPQMIELHNWIRQKGIDTFLVTGRKAPTQKSTVENLKKVGVENYSGIYFKEGKGPSEDYKTRVRKNLVEEGYEIIANIGDQVTDLTGGYAEYVFLLPSTY